MQKSALHDIHSEWPEQDLQPLASHFGVLSLQKCSCETAIPGYTHALQVASLVATTSRTGVKILLAF